MEVFSAFAEIIPSLKGSVSHSPFVSTYGEMEMFAKPTSSPLRAHYLDSAESYSAFWKCDWDKCLNLTRKTFESFDRDMSLDAFVCLDFPSIRFYAIISATRLLLENEISEREGARLRHAHANRRIVPISTSIEELSDTGNNFPLTSITAKSLSNEMVKDLKKFVKQGRQYFKFISKMCPQDHCHRITFIDAELANIKGGDASELYQLASNQAKSNGFTHEAALALDFLSQYYNKLFDSLNAKMFYSKSQQLYELWKGK